MKMLNPHSARRNPISASLLLVCLLGFGAGTQAQAGSVPGLVITGGNNQSADPGTPFLAPLSVRFVDAQGSPVENESVRFTVIPSNGADATLSENVVFTDQAGNASTNATAGQVAGTYVVTALVGNEKLGTSPQGTIDTVDFNLTNRGTPQQATALPAFSNTAALMLVGLLGFMVWRRSKATQRGL